MRIKQCDENKLFNDILICVHWNLHPFGLSFFPFAAMQLEDFFLKKHCTCVQFTLIPQIRMIFEGEWMIRIINGKWVEIKVELHWVLWAGETRWDRHFIYSLCELDWTGRSCTRKLCYFCNVVDAFGSGLFSWTLFNIRIIVVTKIIVIAYLEYTCIFRMVNCVRILNSEIKRKSALSKLCGFE